MDCQIVWLPRAIFRFEEVVHYLSANWSDKQVQDFINRTNEVIGKIKSNPDIFRKSSRNIHEALITKHNLLLYREKRKYVIELLNFFDTRQHPRKKLKG